MTHQEAIARCITNFINQDAEIVSAVLRGDPFDKMLRTYDGYNAEGKRLYQTERARNHYKMSVRAYASGLPVKNLKPEHRIPLKIITSRLINSDKTLESVKKILEENDVILVLKEESTYLDGSAVKGGLGLKATLPKDNKCRLEAGEIQIAPETLTNHL